MSRLRVGRFSDVSNKHFRKEGYSHQTLNGKTENNSERSW